MFACREFDGVKTGEPGSDRRCHERAPIDRIHHAGHAHDESVDYILVNASGFTHGMTGVALRVVLAGTAIPFFEIPLSNAHARETFGRHSHFTGMAVGIRVAPGSRGREFRPAYAVTALAKE